MAQFMTEVVQRCASAEAASKPFAVEVLAAVAAAEAPSPGRARELVTSGAFAALLFSLDVAHNLTLRTSVPVLGGDGHVEGRLKAAVEQAVASAVAEAEKRAAAQKAAAAAAAGTGQWASGTGYGYQGSWDDFDWDDEGRVDERSLVSEEHHARWKRIHAMVCVGGVL